MPCHRSQTAADDDLERLLRLIVLNWLHRARKHVGAPSQATPLRQSRSTAVYSAILSRAASAFSIRTGAQLGDLP